ncbi:flightin isoform X2 [Sitophilus oryzae]|uniref:Flightin isoform X2 n=1 Tax=Sitophilus oryzae TaxID=7048 RepID=A0A6J2YP70_SITOR|nr:flightin isoform X2 [Sitophilus oryzae]
MADDDNADWFSAADEPEAAPEPAAAPAGAAGGAEEAPAAGGEAPAEGGAPEEAAAAEAEADYLDPDKLLLFKHWIRPKYLQYKYIYDYRRSYYDNVIEVIESRRKGYRRNIPRPQTWAERVLRTYSDPFYKLESFDRYLEDVKLVTRSEVSGRLYNYFANETFNKRYNKLSY